MWEDRKGCAPRTSPESARVLHVDIKDYFIFRVSHVAVMISASVSFMKRIGNGHHHLKNPVISYPQSLFRRNCAQIRRAWTPLYNNSSLAKLQWDQKQVIKRTSHFVYTISIHLMQQIVLLAVFSMTACMQPRPAEGAFFLCLHAYLDVSFPQHNHLNARVRQPAGFAVQHEPDVTECSIFNLLKKIGLIHVL